MSEIIIIGRGKLKKEGHYTIPRYLAMITKAFQHTDTVTLQVNVRVEETAVMIINMLGEAYKIERDEKTFRTIKGKKGSVRIVEYTLSKRHSIRLET